MISLTRAWRAGGRGMEYEVSERRSPAEDSSGGAAEREAIRKG
jgi:hypothetical protein